MTAATLRRELRLAIRALKTAQSHLSSAEAQSSFSANGLSARRNLRVIWDGVKDVQRDAHLLDAKLAKEAK